MICRPACAFLTFLSWVHACQNCSCFTLVPGNAHDISHSNLVRYICFSARCYSFLLAPASRFLHCCMGLGHLGVKCAFYVFFKLSGKQKTAASELRTTPNHDLAVKIQRTYSLNYCTWNVQCLRLRHLRSTWFYSTVQYSTSTLQAVCESLLLPDWWSDCCWRPPTLFCQAAELHGSRGWSIVDINEDSGNKSLQTAAGRQLY